MDGQLRDVREEAARIAMRDVTLLELDNPNLVYPVPIQRFMTGFNLVYIKAPAWRHRRCYGALYKGFVFVSGGLSPIETRFTAIHEAGHHRLSIFNSEYRAVNPVVEAAADAYAGGVLVPVEVMRRLFCLRGVTLDMPFVYADLLRLRSVLLAIAYGGDGKQHLKVSVSTLLLALADEGLIEGEEPFASHYSLLDFFWKQSRRAAP